MKSTKKTGSSHAYTRHMIALIASMALARAWPAHDAMCDAQNVCVDGVSRERERETRRWKGRLGDPAYLVAHAP